MEGTRVVKPYIKGLCGQFRYTLAKCKAGVFFKDTSTIQYLTMHPKDPFPDASKTDMYYHWKCPACNCTAENIGETNRSLKERVSELKDHISTKHPKVELKDFTIIDRDSSTLQCWGKYALYICIKESTAKSECLQYSTNLSNLKHN